MNIKKIFTPKYIIIGGVIYTILITSYTLNGLRSTNAKLTKDISVMNNTLYDTLSENTRLKNEITNKNGQIKSLQLVADKYQEHMMELERISDLIVRNSVYKADEPIVLKMAKSIDTYSIVYNVPKEEILALISIESNFNPRLIGYYEDRGLMQIIPSTEKEIAEDLDLVDYDIFDVDTNIKMGTYYISKLKNRYGKYAFIVYNQGFTKPLTQHTYDRISNSSTSYMNKVKTQANIFKGELSE